MGVRKQKDKWGKTNVAVDRSWQDGARYPWLFPTRRLAGEVDTRIKASICSGCWKQLREDLARGEEAKKVTSAEFSKRYIEVYCKLKNRAWVRKRELCPVFGKKALEDIKPSDMDQYFKLWRKAGISNATMNRDLAHLKYLMNFAMKRGVIKQNLTAMVKNFRFGGARGAELNRRHTDFQ